jgi:hypothetical protein
VTASATTRHSQPPVTATLTPPTAREQQQSTRLGREDGHLAALGVSVAVRAVYALQTARDGRVVIARIAVVAEELEALARGSPRPTRDRRRRTALRWARAIALDRIQAAAAALSHAVRGAALPPEEPHPAFSSQVQAKKGRHFNACDHHSDTQLLSLL